MKLLLTSAGVSNASIQDALVQLLGKPIAACDALCIPTAMYGHPMVGPGWRAWQFIAGRAETPPARAQSVPTTGTVRKKWSASA